jgi:hypothetical protein
VEDGVDEDDRDERVGVAVGVVEDVIDISRTEICVVDAVEVAVTVDVEVIMAYAVAIEDTDAVLELDSVGVVVGEGRTQLEIDNPRKLFPRSAERRTFVISALVDVPPAVGMGIVNSISCVGDTP